MTTFQNQIQLFTKCRYFDSILKHEKLSSGDVGVFFLKLKKWLSSGSSSLIHVLKREKHCRGDLGALSMREIAAFTMLKLKKWG